MEELLYGVGIFVPVTDLTRSKKWYMDMLGFELVHEDEPDAYTMKLGDRRVMICLVKCEQIEQPRFPKNNYAVDVYYNFHTDNVDAAYEDLLKKGANIGEIQNYDGIRGFDVRDPDGNRFGVVT
ncbi:VOC family protein [Ornithinibacillus massiliensis]